MTFAEKYMCLCVKYATFSPLSSLLLLSSCLFSHIAPCRRDLCHLPQLFFGHFRRTQKRHFKLRPLSLSLARARTRGSRPLTNLPAIVLIPLYHLRVIAAETANKSRLRLKGSIFHRNLNAAFLGTPLSQAGLSSVAMTTS